MESSRRNLLNDVAILNRCSVELPKTGGLFWLWFSRSVWKPNAQLGCSDEMSHAAYFSEAENTAEN